MTQDGFTFINSSIIGSTAIGANGTTGSQFWIGGPSALEIAATQFGTSVALQKQIGALWVPVASSFVSNQIYYFNAPAGQYRLVSAGSSIAMTAALTKIST